MWNKGVPEITQGEHISPEKTGDNIEAKRVANYVFNTSTLQWERQTNTSSGSTDVSKLSLEATQQLIVSLTNSLESLSETILQYLPLLTSIAASKSPTTASIQTTPLSVPTVANVTTLATLSNQTNIGGFPANSVVPSNMNQTMILSNLNNVTIK